MEDWITVRDAAEQLGVAERTVIKYIHEGQLEAKKEGREWRINPTLEPPPHTEEYHSSAEECDGNAEDLNEVVNMLQHTK